MFATGYPGVMSGSIQAPVFLKTVNSSHHNKNQGTSQVLVPGAGRRPCGVGSSNLSIYKERQKKEHSKGMNYHPCMFDLGIYVTCMESDVVWSLCMCHGKKMNRLKEKKKSMCSRTETQARPEPGWG
jgi:hypothetical protein